MLNADPGTNNSTGEELCLACGLCCNGVLFADVRLQAGEEAARLASRGLPLSGGASPQADGQTPRRVLEPGPRSLRLAQPCPALAGGRCRIYAERPRYCREFECLALKSLITGRLALPAARRVIDTARKRAGKVRSLLRALGDTEEQEPLSARFRRLARRLEGGGLEEDSADLYGQLTLAVHDLNFLLSDAFYP